jgi:diaminopropionate ammonia-lyase
MITPPGLPAGCPPWFEHPGARDWTCAPSPTEVQAFHAGLPGYAATPLTEVPTLAAELGVGRVFVKDESDRMGLPAFKVLGTSWAVHQVLSRRRGDDELTRVTATDGNHGRAVARMARLFGQRAHVFVPGGVHLTAVAAIAAEGAQVTEIAGTYGPTYVMAWTRPSPSPMPTAPPRLAIWRATGYRPAAPPHPRPE